MTQVQHSARITAFDTLRGLTLISMMLFHATYDLVYIHLIDIPWFTQDSLQVFWRNSISWTFLLLAGWMSGISRSNLRRSLRYGCVALAVFLATTVAKIDYPITFGIIFCMAASTFLYSLIQKGLKRTPPLLILACSICLFFITQDVPDSLYPIPGLAWLGFPAEGFYSGDYYPLIPYFFMFLAGASLQRQLNEVSKHPINDGCMWMYKDFLPPISWLGRHSLAVYVVHQPLILLFLAIVLH